MWAKTAPHLDSPSSTYAYIYTPLSDLRSACKTRSAGSLAEVRRRRRGRGRAGAWGRRRRAPAARGGEAAGSGRRRRTAGRRRPGGSGADRRRRLGGAGLSRPGETEARAAAQPGRWGWRCGPRGPATGLPGLAAGMWSGATWRRGSGGGEMSGRVGRVRLGAEMFFFRTRVSDGGRKDPNGGGINRHRGS